MESVSPDAKYPASIRVLHWLIALLIIGLIIAGLTMVRLPHDDPNRATLFALHKSFGLSVLALAALRLALRLRFGAPPLPSVIPGYERVLAQLGHGALYGFMFLMPVSGYLMSASFGLPVRWFGYPVPRLVSIDKVRGSVAGDVHTYAAYALIALIALHIGAVVLHYLKHRVNLLKRMA